MSTNMQHGQLKIWKGLYRQRMAEFDNKKTISEFSVRHGAVHLDRRNARYLVEENIRDDANFDLKLGLREYYEESDEEDSEGSKCGVEESEESCCTFCEWACLQPQQSLKEVFGGADFVGFRTSIRDIAKTVITHRRFWPNNPKPEPIQCKDADEVVFMTRHANPPIKPWARVAMRAGDVIIIWDDSASPFLEDSEDDEYDDFDEEEEESEEGDNVEDERTDGERITDLINGKLTDEIRQQAYSGFKFQQYMTSEDPQGQATPEKRLKVRSFETVMTGDLLDGSEFRSPIRVCCFAECDALRGDEPIELKSTYSEGFFSKVHTYLHCNFANMETLVTGQRNEDWITTRVFQRKVSQLMDDFAPMSQGDSRPDEQCYSFLFDVLTMTKNVLRTANACRFVYLPKAGMIQFEPITVMEAKKRGHGFTRQFKERFNISD